MKLKSILPRFLTRTKDEKALKLVMKDFLKKGPDIIKNKNEGLCFFISRNVDQYGGSRYSCPELFKKLYQKWPHYSGHPLFPVQDKLEGKVCAETCYVGPVCARDQYLELPKTRPNFLWEGKQLEFRKDLAKWIYDQL